jgi:hypothetical protein
MNSAGVVSSVSVNIICISSCCCTVIFAKARTFPVSFSDDAIQTYDAICLSVYVTNSMGMCYNESRREATPPFNCSPIILAFTGMSLSYKTRVNWSVTLKYGHCLNTIVFIFSEDLHQRVCEQARGGLTCISSRLAKIQLQMEGDTNVESSTIPLFSWNQQCK